MEQPCLLYTLPHLHHELETAKLILPRRICARMKPGPFLLKPESKGVV